MLDDYTGSMVSCIKQRTLLDSLGFKPNERAKGGLSKDEHGNARD